MAARLARGTPRRGELTAALGVLAIIGHLLLAQLTLVLAAALQLTGRLARWRPLWLAAPAAAGLVWVLAIGPAAAWHGFTEGPRQVLGYFAGAVSDPARLFRPGQAYAGLGHWLPGQAPLALLLAAAEATLAGWRRRRRAGPDGRPPARPGLITLARRQYTASFVKAGGVVSRSGACLGVDWCTGRVAGVPWAAAGGGVLVTGAGPGTVSAAAFQLVHAAVRRRQPVVVVDLAAPRGLAGALGAVCAGTGAPLHVFGAAGPGCYDPLRGRTPARQAAMVMGMIDWTVPADCAPRTARDFLNDLFAVTAAAPGDPAAAVLDDVVALLLSPDALGARLRRVPAGDPRRAPLAERVRVSAGRLQADPATAAFLAGELARLRSSALGRWLRPAGPVRGDTAISLAAAVRDRAVVLFSLPAARHGPAARMIANLVAHDLAATAAGIAEAGTGGDGLAWFGDSEVLADAALDGLLAAGPRAGLATVLSTVSRGAAERLAAKANVLVIQWLNDPGAALAGLPGPGRPDEFVLAVRQPRQVVRHGRFIPAVIQ
jgi:hypothetical protein